MTIFLVGSMGVGKSAIGRRLAGNMDIAFVDTDDLLVAQEGLSINEIFSQHGEPQFRALESELLTGLDLTKSRLIATGGGLPVTEGNMEYMRDNGIVVFLKADLDTIATRLYRGRYKRPAIKDLNMEQIKIRLVKMLADRTPIYERAHLTFLRADNLDDDAAQLSTYLKMYV